MSEKSADNKAKSKVKPTAQPAQPTGESAPIIETLTPDEQQFLEAVRRGDGILAARQAERNAKIDAAAERLKAMKSDEDLDKALDFIGRITGDGGHYRHGQLKHETPFHTFYGLSLHLACAIWQDWFDEDELFAGDEPGGNEKADLTQFVPWINSRIHEAFNQHKVDYTCLVEMINASEWKHVEWVDKRGVQIWLGSDNLKERVAEQAAQETDSGDDTEADE